MQNLNIDLYLDFSVACLHIIIHRFTIHKAYQTLSLCCTCFWLKRYCLTRARQPGGAACCYPPGSLGGSPVPSLIPTADFRCWTLFQHALLLSPTAGRGACFMQRSLTPQWFGWAPSTPFTTWLWSKRTEYLNHGFTLSSINAVNSSVVTLVFRQQKGEKKWYS